MPRVNISIQDFMSMLIADIDFITDLEREESAYAEREESEVKIA